MGSARRFGAKASGNYCPPICHPGAPLIITCGTWRRRGTCEQIHNTVREWVRAAAGRERQSSGAVLDSQSVRTSEQGGPRGYDGAEKLCGRKRHLLVDTLGLVLLVVTAANVQDRDGSQTLF